MSKKFTTVVTSQGMQILSQAIANQVDLNLVKAVASTSAYSTESLESLTDDNYKSASKAQETTINKIESRSDGTLLLEIVFDGSNVRYDYTLNTIFIIAEIKGKERLFAVIQANQPQYMNAYDGSSRTNLQINFALRINNSEANITINSAAMATTKDLNDLKAEITGDYEDADRSLKNEIAKNKQEAERNLQQTRETLDANIAQKVDRDTYTNFVNQTNQTLNTKLTASDLNGYAKTSEVEDTANSLRTSIDNVNGKLTNLYIGGRNLIKQSQLGSNYKHAAWYEAFGGVTWNSDTVELNVGDKDCVQIEQRVYDIEPDTDYVFSFDLNYVDGQHRDKQGFIFWEFKDRACKQTTNVYKDNWNIANMSNFPNTPGRTDKKLVLHTQPDTHAIIFMARSLKGAKLPFRFSKVKFEKGSVPTDWTPALEDLDSQLSDINNEIKSNERLIANGSDRVDTLINNLNTQNLVYNSEFNNDAEGWVLGNTGKDKIIIFANNEWDSYKGSNGLAFRNTTGGLEMSATSKSIKVTSDSKLSANVWMHVTDNITNGNCQAEMSIIFFKNENTGYISDWQPQKTKTAKNLKNGQQQLLYCNNISVPSGAKYASIRLATTGIGNVIFNQPMMSFGESYIPYIQNTGLLGTLAGKYPKLDTRLTKLEESISNRKAPTSWSLDRTKTPWTIWFDNGAGLQFPDYATTDTVYGYGHSFENSLTNKFAAFPLVYNVINCARGAITLESFAEIDGSDFMYWSPTTKVIDPIKDASKYDWTNAIGNRDTNNDRLKRKPNFARVMYELGIWSDADVKSLGAVRR